MSIRIILVPLSGNETCKSGCEAAARAAKAFGAHLIGLHVRLDPSSAVPFIADGLTADIVQELVASAEREGERKARHAKQVFEETCAQFDLPFRQVDDGAKGPSAEWLERQGVIGETVGRIARIADVTVVPKPTAESDPMTASLLDDVLTRSGRAVLMAPDNLPGRIAENVIIAWNGSTEAARAVADAMPFITRADKVTILTVGQLKAERPDGAALAHSLRCHGVEPELMQITTHKGTVGETILQAADEVGATLLVIGAFSHSRWRELILGGVTRTIIDKVSLPVLMSH